MTAECMSNDRIFSTIRIFRAVKNQRHRPNPEMRFQNYQGANLN